MHFSHLHSQHFNKIAAKLTGAAELQGWQLSALEDFWIRLQQDETKLVKLLNGEDPPDKPGNVEFGWVLFVLNHPPLALEGLLKLLETLGLEIPPSQITKADLARWHHTLETTGVSDSEGEMIQEAKYASLDPGWAYSLILYILYKLDIGSYQKADFGNLPQTIQFSGNTLKIAILGDWGTGKWQDGSDANGPAIAVRDKAASLDPDIAIHLGDVYYAGTEDGVFGIGSGEEEDNFVTLWKPARLGNFTLNSNHEMYDGGNGYFSVALKAAAFRQQNGTSYFALEFGNWLILGLDSAYSDPSHLYMDGAINEQQIQFIQGLPLAGKRIVVMTHHNPIDYKGTTIVNQGKPDCLWQQVSDALGRAPDFWYWGHLHNGIAYSDQSITGPSTYGRCVGHGAFPFGLAYGLLSDSDDPGSAPIPSVDYFAHTPIKSPTVKQQKRVYNGFAMITLGADSLKEAFYELGSRGAVWEKTITVI